MMEMEKNMITVSTEEIRMISDDVDRQIDRVQRAFDEIQKEIDRSYQYWEGEGRNSFVSAYQRKQDQIRTALARFREQTSDLRTMAGIYEEAESGNVEQSGSLSDNVII